MVLTSQTRNIRPEVLDQPFNRDKVVPAFLVSFMPMVALTPFVVVPHQAITGALRPWPSPSTDPAKELRDHIAGLALTQCPQLALL